jgi:hypothetical protein
MTNQTIVKPLGLIKDLKILVHEIPCAMTFIVIQSSVLDSSYSMLLRCPWLRDVKVSHDWGNDIITIQGLDTVRTIHVTKKLGTPNKCPEVLVYYDFHFGISNKEEDLMFTTKPILFSIRTIVVPTSVWSYQHVKLITSVGLNLVKHVNKLVEPVYEPLISCDVPIKPVLVQLIKIVIPPNTFQQHLPKTFIRPKKGEMEINETPI